MKAQDYASDLLCLLDNRPGHEPNMSCAIETYMAWYYDMGSCRFLKRVLTELYKFDQSKTVVKFIESVQD